MKSDKIANILEPNAIFMAQYDEDGEFIFTFNGGENFLQIDFLYFSQDVTDLYQNTNSKTILPQSIDLMSLSVFV